MWASGQMLEAEAAAAAKAKAEGIKVKKLNPAVLKERLRKKKAAARAAKLEARSR